MKNLIKHQKVSKYDENDCVNIAKFLKNSFSYRTPLVATSVSKKMIQGSGKECFKQAEITTEKQL